MPLQPPERLRRALHQARRAGRTFDQAWKPAVATALAGENPAWALALNGTRDAWRRAYLGEPPSRGERAVSLLYEDAELVPVTAERGQCEHCAGDLPPNGRANRRYCSSECKRAANYQRERAAA
jgi:hypothetical protein